MEADAAFLIQNWITECQWWLWFILDDIFVQSWMLVQNMYSEYILNHNGYYCTPSHEADGVNRLKNKLITYVWT